MVVSLIKSKLQKVFKPTRAPLKITELDVKHQSDRIQAYCGKHVIEIDAVSTKRIQQIIAEFHNKLAKAQND